MSDKMPVDVSGQAGFACQAVPEHSFPEIPLAKLIQNADIFHRLGLGDRNQRHLFLLKFFRQLPVYLDIDAHLPGLNDRSPPISGYFG